MGYQSRAGLIMNTSHDDTLDAEEPIYSKDIVLSYRPPTRLPPPFPETLRIQGLALYQGSSVLLKSSFTALHSDCTVVLERMSILPCGPRERKVRIDLNMQGVARLSSTISAWTVSSTYHFSPISGLIYKHDIESIYPEPHSAVFESMRKALLRLTGIKPRSPEEAGNLEGIKVPIQSREHTSYPFLRPRNNR
ncbi:uncharacterized protein EI90DRAFT_1605536 [Cantharellus anzutake]|uniref:uncharacterized protein n=1 Tax=Cantharellus anzutake TaxID=1750568 RepID=UPI001908E32B|nr:uncharacterized protein EI90DRAFT_1605536 [Cantharellus anzutake]KAF8328145.1 hypothetical protein EI90DRAFT_1605536 [Cantharellus anzutake]